MLKSFYKKAKKLDPSSVVREAEFSDDAMDYKRKYDPKSVVRPDEVFGKMGQRLGGSVVKKAMKKAMSK